MNQTNINSNTAAPNKLERAPQNGHDTTTHQNLVENPNYLNVMVGDSLMLQSQVLTLIHAHLPQWEDWIDVQDPNSLTLERLSGAMTNCIYIVNGPHRRVSDSLNSPASTESSFLPHLDTRDTVGNLVAHSDAHEPATRSLHPLPKFQGVVPRRLILRVYGVGMHNYIKRDRELYWLRILSEFGYGAKLLATFENGRFEEYLDSTTLTKYQLRDPSISVRIAQKLCDLHHLSNKLIYDGIAESNHPTVPIAHPKYPEIWSSVQKFLVMAEQAVQRIVSKNPDRNARVRSLNLNGLEALIHRLHIHIDQLHLPIVFAHNDLQYGNILLHSISKEVILVDYEYSSFNYRGFDTANHFCEWMADYHCPTPHRLAFSHFPNMDERARFYRAYLQHSTGQPPSRESVESMELETMTCILLSHLYWGLWGIVREADQLGRREIDFDYFEYGAQRIETFHRIFDAIMELSQ